NALGASPKRMVQLTAQHDTQQQRLVIAVTDDGAGMDDYTLSHAMDPFFSAKPAGRQIGMGLPRAKQWAAAHGGDLELRSTPEVGTVATLWVPLAPAGTDDPAPPNAPRPRGRRKASNDARRAVSA